MLASSAYMRLVAASDVEEALLAQLQKWLPDYLAETERQHGVAPGSWPLPRSWLISSEVEKMPEDQLPAVILASPGLTDPPLADGRGVYTARWLITVAVMVSARGNRLALRLARLYALAIRALAVQQQALAGVAVRRVEWLEERYRALDSIDDRTVCIAEVDVVVEVSDVTTRHAGPLEPILGPTPPGQTPPPDSPEWPEAQTTDVQLVKVPLEEEP